MLPVALNASGYNLQRLWTGKKLYASGRIGLGTNLRLNDHVAINVELNTNCLLYTSLLMSIAAVSMPLLLIVGKMILPSMR